MPAALLDLVPSHPPQSRLRLARLPQEPRRLRSHDGPAPPQRRGAHPRAEDAEIIVINTCSFIDSAKQESVNTILEMVQHKRERRQSQPHRRRRLPGRALPRRDPEEHPGGRRRRRHRRARSHPRTAAGLSQPPPSSRLLASSHALHTSRLASIAAPAPRRPPALAPRLKTRAQLAHRHHSRPEGDAREQSGRFSRDSWDGATAALPSYLYSDETPRILSTPRASAYIKIAEGCDHPCTFCIIPQLRGKFRSRRMGSIIAEAQNLIAQGVREITLIGQDTTCYGEDLGLKEGLAQLLDALAVLPGLQVAPLPLHLPQQGHHAPARDHGEARHHRQVPRRARCSTPAPASSRRMKRGGNAQIFLDLIAKARQHRPRHRHPHLASSSASPAKPKPTSPSSAPSCRPQRSTGSASSPTRTKKAPRPSTSPPPPRSQPAPSRRAAAR